MKDKILWDADASWATGENENVVSASLTVDDRSDNEPDEYKATVQFFS